MGRPNDPVPASELADGDDASLDDHVVPPHLLELHEVLEWQRAVDLAGDTDASLVDEARG